jgi:eukaryotic-like serine/threonine-protein kinase
MYLPSSGTLVAGKYQLEALLGEGGMGAVYRARHVLMDKPVALKWLRPELCSNAEARERLVREARSVARVRHPNVVQVYDVDSFEGSLFMVMELLEGQTFADLVASETLSAPRLIELLTGAMEGLAAAHERGIVHRDIKPENIFIVRDERHPEGLAKLLDFGISKLDERSSGNPRLTQTGLSIGTPLYMSVEQLTRTEEVDQRSDIYSFGVVLYHALSGTLPFDGETFAGVVLSIATTRPVPLKRLRPELPLALDRIVTKAMARHPRDRYATVKELIAALRSLQLGDAPDGHGARAVAYAASRTPAPPVAQDAELDDSLATMLHAQQAWGRRRVAIAIALALLLLVGGAVGLYRTGRPAQAGVSAPPKLPVPASSEPRVEPAPELVPLPFSAAGAGPVVPAQERGPAAAAAAPRAEGPRARSSRRAPRASARLERDRADTQVEQGSAAAEVRAASAPRDKPAGESSPRTPPGKSGGLLREDF